MPSLAMITFDTTDTRRLSAWWAQRLGASIEFEAEHFFTVLNVPGWSTNLGFQYVESPTPDKNRIHLDLEWEPGQNREDGVAEWEAAGAVHLGRRGEGAMTWDTFADPDGNHFCLAEPED